MTQRPIVLVLDDYEHAARRLTDWSAVEALADLRVQHAPLTATRCARRWRRSTPWC